MAAENDIVDAVAALTVQDFNVGDKVVIMPRRQIDADYNKAEVVRVNAKSYRLKIYRSSGEEDIEVTIRKDSGKVMSLEDFHKLGLPPLPHYHESAIFLNSHD